MKTCSLRIWKEGNYPLHNFLLEPLQYCIDFFFFFQLFEYRSNAYICKCDHQAYVKLHRELDIQEHSPKILVSDHTVSI
jgi:hypothetical protein